MEEATDGSHAKKSKDGMKLPTVLVLTLVLTPDFDDSSTVPPARHRAVHWVPKRRAARNGRSQMGEAMTGKVTGLVGVAWVSDTGRRIAYGSIGIDDGVYGFFLSFVFVQGAQDFGVAEAQMQMGLVKL